MAEHPVQREHTQHTQTAGKEVPSAKETRLNQSGTWLSKPI